MELRSVLRNSIRARRPASARVNLNVPGRQRGARCVSEARPATHFLFENDSKPCGERPKIREKFHFASGSAAMLRRGNALKCTLTSVIVSRLRCAAEESDQGEL